MSVDPANSGRSKGARLVLIELPYCTGAVKHLINTHRHLFFYDVSKAV